MSVRNEFFARKAAIFSGIFQIIPVIVFLVLGIVFLALFRENPILDDINGVVAYSSLPSVVIWGLTCAVAAVLMASFASLLNTTSLLVTFDFYRSFRPETSDRKMVLVGRLVVMVLVLYSILLIPVVQSIDFGVCIKLFKGFIYFTAVIAAILVSGIFKKNIKAYNVLWTLYAGTALIIIRSVLDAVDPDKYSGIIILKWVINSNFLDFTVFTFLFSILFLFVSLIFKPYSTRNSVVST